MPSDTGCNVPTRPAPAPPSNSVSRRNSVTEVEREKKHGLDFGRRASSLAIPFRSQSTSDVSKKKKPPPRPPPPKIASNSKKQNTSTILSNLFRKNSLIASRPTHTVLSTDVVKAAPVPASVPVASLIDLHSPPSSPTFTTRSSSDGVSVDSLSSDNGNTSASGNYGTSSQVESGFEDDFSLFPFTSDNKDSDPFSPVPKTICINPGFQLSNDDPKLKVKALDLPATKNPTIIRTKQSKAPLRPPPPAISQNSNFSDSIWTTPQSNSFSTPLDSASFDCLNEFSPPMPSVPPPPPPIEVLQVLSSGPPVPPRPALGIKRSEEVKSEQPYCIALYDYIADHESDLSFRENDIILLTKEVNEDWFMGCLNGREGMFPSNYVEVKVPITNSNISSSCSHQKVIAIFDFHAESWDDLSLQTGDEVTVLDEINKDWLYGEIGDRKGQFPVSFVSPLPDS